MAEEFGFLPLTWTEFSTPGCFRNLGSGALDERAYYLSKKKKKIT